MRTSCVSVTVNICRWEAPQVRSLVCEEPLVLLLPAAAVSNRWRRLQQAAEPRSEWKQLVSRADWCIHTLLIQMLYCQIAMQCTKT
jgi:hypothetical protein